MFGSYFRGGDVEIKKWLSQIVYTCMYLCHFQCFIEALGYKQMTELCLTGHHYPSLAELAMDKFCEVKKLLTLTEK